MELSERKKTVPTEFDDVAGSYDLLATLNPGYHRHLRMSAERLRLSGARPRVLDLCCGTGASTEALVSVYPDAEVTALDGSRGMLREARDKPMLGGVDFVHGDGADPAAAGVEGPFDGILMAYGIRNLPDADAALANLYELLTPGGVICFHEYSVAHSPVSRALFSAVCYGVIVPLGAVMSGNAEIFRYLHRSVQAFDAAPAFEARLRRAGFESVATEPMDGWQRGIVHSFVARRPREGGSR